MGFRRLILFSLIMLATAGCKKPVVENNPDSPVPIQLTASVKNSVGTKASVESWDDTEVYVFGLKYVSGGYDYDDPYNIVDKRAIISSDNQVSLYSDSQTGAPYYYSEGEAYDFYGYHLGGAEVTGVVKGKDSYSLSVTLDGNNDILYATTDKDEDLRSYGGYDLDVNQLYSARSARRGLHPVLRFSHALTRFKFIVKGMGENSSMFQIASLQVEAGNSGTLVLGRNEVYFIPSGEISVLRLESGDEEFQTTQVVPGASIPLGGTDASLMVVPGADSIKVTMNFLKNYESIKDNYSFVVRASEIPLKDVNGNIYYSRTFRTGTSYNIYMYVYGLEKIEISSSVDDWNPAGDFEIDPDDYDQPSVEPDIPDDDSIETGDISVDDYEDGDDLGNNDLE